MGVAIPQIITEDRASGALVVDGSLRFDGDKLHQLTRTPSSTGNRRTWTFSCWLKRTKITDTWEPILYVPSGSAYNFIGFTSNQLYLQQWNGSSTVFEAYTASTGPLYRDISGWYHIVVAVDTTIASPTSDRLKMYVNGIQVPVTANYGSQNLDTYLNINSIHYIANWAGNSHYLDGQITTTYLIDGQALDPSYFGYTDALTNTWRPKKLSSSVAFGTNGFYLPFDGSAPIGQDQSGRGNNWTPVNFGGSNTLEKATGALPILNTDGGGKVARVGVRTDSSASSLVLALPLVGIKSDFSNAVNSGTSNKAITANGNAVASSAQSNFYGGSFAFDGTGDFLSVPYSSDIDIGAGDFTIECWIYKNAASEMQIFDFRGNPCSTGWALYTKSNGALEIYDSVAGTQLGNSSPYNLTVSTWNHIALTKSGSTVTFWINGLNGGTFTRSSLASTTSLRIGISCDGNSSINGYLQDVRLYKGLAKYTSNFIPASTDPDILPDTPSGVSYTSNLTQITDGAVALDGSGDYLELPYSSDLDFTGQFTLEAFVYPNASTGDYSVFGNFLANATGNWGLAFDYSTYGIFTTFYYQGNNSVANTGYVPIPRVWNHYAVTRDASNVIRVFLNGQLLPTTATYSGTLGVSAQSTFIGLRGGLNALNGFISNVHWVKGTCLYTANFTPPTAGISSVANTKLLCCKSNVSAVAFDVSPGTITANGNAVATNFNPFTVNINTQRGKQSGWATWNPLDTAGSTLSNGNLNITTPYSGLGVTRGTIGVSGGKWYYEHTIISGATGVGIMKLTDAIVSSQILGVTSGGYSYYSEGVAGGGYTKKINSNTQTDYGASFDPGDTISVAFDLDAGTITFYKNGVSQGVAFSGLSGTFSAAISDGTNAGSIVGATNFGQKPFKFPPPAGFQPLALANTPRPTIVRPDQFVGVTTYTGTGAARDVNVGFKPDFVWIKDRTNGYNHVLFDSVRGTGGSKVLFSNRTTAEGGGTGEEGTVYGHVSSFDNYGFSVSPGSGTPLWVSNSGDNYVAWSWKAGGNSNTYNINDVGYATASAAGLTAGSITPTGASVNTKSGFSIITWTRASTADSISHGLGVAPKFIICKSRSNDIGWMIGHAGLDSTSPWNYRIFFDTGARNSDGNTSWNGVPTSSVFYTGNTGYITGNMVAYCWAEVPGFSKFGSYTGGGSAGRFIYTGFKPKVIWVKNYNSSSYLSYTGWYMWDSVRSTYNYNQSSLIASSAYQEGIRNNGGSIYSVGVDILSNGFCLRGADDADTNWASGEYIYCAWGEVPTQNLYGAQSNAR